MKNVEEFKASLRGSLLHPGEDGYDQARKIWNGMFDRRPALIARCAGAADVISAVNFARDNKLQVAVRGGGHSFPGHSVCDGGVVIDLSPMKAIRVDPATDPVAHRLTWEAHHRYSRRCNRSNGATRRPT